MDGSDALNDAVDSFARAKGLFSPAAMGYYQGALQARQHLASAAIIFDRAQAIARDACELARPSFERSGLMVHADALASAERDLCMFAQVCARALTGADRDLEKGYLRQVATASSLGMDFHDSSPLLLGFAWCAAANHLQGQALWCFRAACERAQSALRNAASGAALSAAAGDIGAGAYPMLSSAHPELDQIYGAVTAAKCPRDMSMMLGTAAHEWLAEGRQTPLTQWISWLVAAIGPHVARYSGDVWGSVFASLAAASLSRVPTQQLPGCAAPLLEISLHGHALRRAVHGLLRAEDAGHLSARRNSESVAAAPHHQQRVARLFAALACASVVGDHAYAEKAVADLLNEVRTSSSEPCLLGLASAGSEAMGVAYTPFVAQAIDAGVDSARAFALLQGEWRHLPDIAKGVVDQLSLPTGMLPWLTGVLALLLELATSRSAPRAELALGDRLLADFLGLSGSTPAIEAQALRALAARVREHPASAVARLSTLLSSLGAMTDRWEVVFVMRAASNRGDASESWTGALSARLAVVLINNASENSIADTVHWLATAWVPHVRFALPEQSPEVLAAPAIAELQAQLPIEQHGRIAQLAEGIADAATAHAMLANADAWCAQAVAEMRTRPSFASVRGIETRCIRDLTILLKSIACFLGSGLGDVPIRVRAFAAAHLLPFLQEETRNFGTELVAVLQAQMAQLSGTSRNRVAALLASVYQHDGAPQ